jgi:hypothetical protein
MGQTKGLDGIVHLREQIVRNRKIYLILLAHEPALLEIKNLMMTSI